MVNCSAVLWLLITRHVFPQLPIEPGIKMVLGGLASETVSGAEESSLIERPVTPPSLMTALGSNV